VTQGEPLARQHQPDQVAQEAKAPGPEVAAARVSVPENHAVAKWQQGVGRNVECGPCSRKAHDRECQ
jgi:hypothetical protein